MKILKVIEEKTVRPVGGGAARTVDVEVIAATNGDLETMVRAGTFREDLYYRLCVVRLTVPPLRERGSDVTLLARRFLRELASAGLSLPAPTTDTITLGVDEHGEVSVEIPDGGIVFETVERTLLVEALRRSGGSQSGAARLLGMTRATLRYRLEKFGIAAAPARGR